MRKKLNFKLAKEINTKMVFLYFGIYIFILLMLCAFLIPQLYKGSDKFAQHTLEVTTDEFSSAQENLSTNINFLYAELPSLLKSYDNAPSAASTADIELFLTNYVGYQDVLLAASLEDFQHHFFRSNYYHNVVNQENLQKDASYQKLFSGESTSYYTFYPDDFFRVSSATMKIYHYALGYSKVQYFNQKPYVLTVYYDLNAVMRHRQALFDGFFTSFAIYSPKGGILYSLSESDSFSFEQIDADHLFDYRKSSGSTNIKSGQIYYNKDSYANWIYLAYSPNVLFFNDAITIIGIITALYLISPLLYTFLLYPIVNKALAPLARLYEAMMHYSPSAPTAPLKIKTGNEIEGLCNMYNQMTSKITQQIQEIQDKEHANAVTNYKLLATQIDPHFIYNTMNIINIMARQGKDREIIEINSALIKILRERLNSKLSIVDTLEKELGSLYQYQVIMNYRYEKQVSISIDVDDTLLQKKVPKNILQPLAENSFYHGFANLKKNEKGQIDILVYPQDDNMVIELSDNGAGMDKERLQMIREHSYRIYDDHKPHIGLDNIRQRLYYVYGDNYQFDIISSPGCGTTISITIPTEHAEKI